MKLLDFFKVTKNLIITGLVITGICMFFLQKCSYDKRLEASNQTIDSLTLANQRIDSVKNKLGQKIVEQEVIVTNSQKAIKELSDEKFNLTQKYEKKIKQVIAFYSEQTNTHIDSVKVPYVDTLERKKFSDSLEKYCNSVIQYYEDSTVRVGTRALDSTAQYKVDATIQKNGLEINNISFPDSQYVRFNILKGGLLKRDQNHKLHLFLKKQMQVQVLHTNSKIEVEKSNSVFYVPLPKGKWLERAILIGAGVFLGTKL